MVLTFDLLLCIKIILLVVFLVIIVRLILKYFGYDFTFNFTYEDSEDRKAREKYRKINDTHNALMRAILKFIKLLDEEKNEIDMKSMQRAIFNIQKDEQSDEIAKLIRRTKKLHS